MDLTGTFAWTGDHDFSGATNTTPNKVGTTPPGTCSVGDTYFDTDATAGQRFLNCDPANTWTAHGDGGGAPGTDSIGTDELDDSADTPLAGEWVQVSGDTTDFVYRTDAELISDTGALTSTHTSDIDAHYTGVADDQILLGSGASAAAFATIPDCNTENMLTYTQSTNTWGCESDTDSGGSPTWEGLVNTADTATTYTADNTAELVTFDFQHALGSGSFFKIQQSVGNPSATVLLDLEVSDGSVKAFQATDSSGDGVELSINGDLVAVGSGNIDATRVNSDGDSIAEIYLGGSIINFDPDDDASPEATIGSGGQVRAGSGIVTSTGLSFKDDTNTGLYNTADVVHVAAGGVEAARFSTAASGVNYLEITPAATGSNPQIAAAGTDSAIGLDIHSKSTDPIRFFVDGLQKFDLNSARFKGFAAGSASLRNSAASNTNPSLAPDSGDIDTGIGQAGEDQLTLVAGGDEAWTFSEGAAGTSAGDSIAFISDVVTAPTSNPTGGVYLYSDADTLYIRDTGGTVTDLAGAASGDVGAVGPGCASGDCLTDGLATTGTTLAVWEGNVADAEQVTFAMSSAEPAAAYTITFPDATGEVSLLGQAITTGEITDDTLTTGDLADDVDTPSEGQLIAVAETTTEMRYVKPPSITKTIFNPDGLDTADDVPDIHIWAEAVVVTDVRCISTGATSLTVTLEDDTGTDLVTGCVATTSLVDCTLAGGTTFSALERMDWDTTAVNGSPTSASCFIEYKYDL
jgi:hypothetical protein